MRSTVGVFCLGAFVGFLAGASLHTEDTFLRRVFDKHTLCISTASFNQNLTPHEEFNATRTLAPPAPPPPPLETLNRLDASGGNLQHRTISKDRIVELYETKVRPTPAYLRKYEDIVPFVAENKRLGRRWQWEGKAFPRVPTVLDFREWVVKHSLEEPSHLLTTDPTDPELEHVRPKKVTVYQHNRRGTPNGGDLHHIPHAAVNPDRDFDLVVFSQTLEHLYDPMLCLRNLFDAMAPGGALFTSTCTTNRPHMTPFHFFHYTPMGLAILMERAGFTVLEVGMWGNADYEVAMLKRGLWADYRSLREVAPNITNDSTRGTDDVWILARKPGAVV